LLALVIDEENIPMKTIVAVAGRELTLPCPGVNEQSLVDTLTWKSSQMTIKHFDGMPLMLKRRVSESKHKWTTK
jgi:receptor-type tyrosine-protein phosphatase gamma